MLKKLIAEYIGSKNNGTKLFPQQPQGVLRRIFQKYSARPISVNILRHSYLTYLQNKGTLNDLAVRRNISKMMGTSISRSLAYYVKNEDQFNN